MHSLERLQNTFACVLVGERIIIDSHSDFSTVETLQSLKTSVARYSTRPHSCLYFVASRAGMNHWYSANAAMSVAAQLWLPSLYQATVPCRLEHVVLLLNVNGCQKSDTPKRGGVLRGPDAMINGETPSNALSATFQGFING